MSFYSIAQKLIPPPIFQANWLHEYKPYRIVGNLYYVGSFDLGCYLITTPKGHILINTGLDESAGMIRSHVEELGFRFQDIKILLATHGHYDHVGAMAEIKSITGAKLMINEKDSSVLADGGNSDYSFGGKGSTFKPVKPDHLLHNNDTIMLDNMRIVMLHHPGHTKGASSYLFDVKDETRTYRVLIANMPTVLDETTLPSMPTYPEAGKDYAYTIENMKKIRFDIWLASHAGQFGMHRKRKPGDGYKPEVFIDQQGYDLLIADLEKRYLRRLGQN